MSILLIITIAFSVLWLGMFVTLHVRYPEFNIMRNTVSDYGTGGSAKLYSVMGLFERLFLAATPVWFIVFSVLLLINQ